MRTRPSRKLKLSRLPGASGELVELLLIPNDFGWVPGGCSYPAINFFPALPKVLLGTFGADRTDEPFEAIEVLMRTSASSAVVEDVLDRSAALAHMDGDADLLAEMAGLLLQDHPSQLSSVRAAVAARDTKLIERSAHKLKGSLGVFGAKQAFDAALSLEMLGKGGDLTRADETLGVLEEALKRLTPALEELAAHPA